MATVRTSAATRSYSLHVLEFRSGCPRRETSGKWKSTTPSTISLEISSPHCRYLAFPGFQQLSRGNKIACSTPWCLEILSFLHASPSDTTPPFHCLLDCFVQCPALCYLSTGSSSSTGSCCGLCQPVSCLISNSCRLADPISSPSLGVVAAQHAPIMTDHVVHRSFPSCSPECTFGFVFFKLRCFQRYPFFSAVEPHLPWQWPSRFSTIPALVSPAARTSETVSQTQSAGQNECSAAMLKVVIKTSQVSCD